MQIIGEKEYDKKLLENISYQKNHQDLNSAESEVNLLLNNLQKMGYIDAKITRKDFNKNENIYTFIYIAGNKIETIHLLTSQEDRDFLEQELQIPLKDTLKISFSETEIYLQNLNQKISNSGKPFSLLYIKDIFKRENLLFGNLVFYYSEDRKIDGIKILGYEKFPKGYLKHFLKIKANQKFNKSIIDKKINSLKTLNFVEIAKPAEILFEKDSTILYVYLKKRNQNNFNGYLGFATNEVDNSLQLNGLVDLNLLNNLNFGESLKLLYRNDGEGQIEFNLDMNFPYIFKTPFGLEAGLNIFRKDSTFNNTQQKIGLNYILNSTSTFFTKYRFTSSTNLANENLINAVQDFKSNKVYVGANLILNQIENNLTREPNRLYTEIGFGSRDVGDLKTDQIDLIGNYQFQFPLNDRNFIYLNNHNFYLISDNYLLNELPRFGGINTIRGFQENSIPANLYTITQLEYQYLASSNLVLHSITDFAYFKNNIDTTSETLTSIGFGLKLMTNSGILHLMFANGKTENQNFQFNSTKVHIVYTVTF
ncbi:hypothetical protein [Mesonia sp. K7]|uniref:hypothetical protein n=1 Tax=Mesonia sp. K7 TaxID=2218606 RepID=UPI000DA9B134|nr:hypothetical protein [Mesonia sp. K7]PZD77539.1 hypothetical protein DNG35_08120 [Mesonia sp. K7]